MTKIAGKVIAKLNGKECVMSNNLNRAKLNNSHDNHEYHIIWLKLEFEPYWDEGLNFYPKYRRGYKNTKKQILSYQVRMYRSWKHNRKYQYKI